MKTAKRVKRVPNVNQKKKRIIRIFIIILAVIILGIIGFIANDYIIVGKNEKTNLVINNNNVTDYLKNEILIQDDEIYVSKDDLANFFDKYIYEDTENNQIVTTYEDKIAAIGFDENQMTVNGSNTSTYAHAIKENNQIYLPLTELKDVYGIEIENIEDSKVVTVDSISREQKRLLQMQIWQLNLLRTLFQGL